MRSVQEYPTYLVEIAFKEDPTVYELLTIAVAFGVFWAIVFEIVKSLLRRLTYGRPWLRSACEREYERGMKVSLEKLGLNLTKEEAINNMMRDWPDMIVVTVQHAIGAMFCIPSLLGLGDASWASSLACLGCLSEAGWEMEHTAEIAYTRLIKENGEKKYPNVLVFIYLLHHTLTSTLGMPMVLYYRDLWIFHQLVFELQFVAVSLVLIEYSKLLDISKSNDLWKFKLCNFLVLAIAMWTRVIHWVYLSVHMILTWYHDKAWTFLVVGSIMILLFSFFNAVGQVIPMYQRYMKFLRVSAEHESLPIGASDKVRRQSMVQLNAATTLLLENSLEDRINSFLNSLENREKVNRRQSMPPLAVENLASVRMMRYASVRVPTQTWKEE
jgi:hypothetical protein